MMSDDAGKCVRENQANITRSDAEHVTRAELYPALSENERSQALANLRRYFEIALAIAKAAANREDGLTDPDSVPTMKERSSDHWKT